MDDERPHGEVGAEIAVNYLDSLGVDPQQIAKIGEIIMIHEMCIRDSHATSQSLTSLFGAAYPPYSTI